MKRIFTTACIALMGMSAAGQTFKKGDFLINVGLGVGKIEECGSTFTQKVSFEWAIAKIGKKGTIGLGATLNNSYGGKVDGVVAGTYDYKVNTTMYKYAQNHNRWTMSNSPGAPIHREGVGQADATFSREDLKAMAIVSYHHALTQKLDVYGSFGLGVGLINGLCGDFRNYDGFEKETKRNDINTHEKRNQYCLTYSYDDLEHVDFSDYRFHKVAFSCGIYAGARYSFTERIGAFAETGMVSGIFKDDYPKGLDVFTLGISFKL